ncbi:MAG: pyridoxamine 5'-phosphate oxidase family protein [Acidimicrobiia bacterium]|nr:pyridoxamine 5'-phosphate oxidase family protein [Acidimicrobiia bacterium]MYG72386.1 pyridoxamine 5'-phosphate oxidase family protein [Acidimicrobiia bacterium]
MGTSHAIAPKFSLESQSQWPSGQDSTMVRTTAQRVKDSIAKLEAGGDAWLATAGPAGPHLVPLTLVWDSAAGELIFCIEQGTVTARNIATEPSVRVGIGPTRDVLMIDGTAQITGLVNDDISLAAFFYEKAGWDPRLNGDNMIFIRVTPSRMQAWREVDEAANRAVMVNGVWRTTDES